MGKVLALDIGEKRVGVAVSDSSRQFAFPRETISVEKDFGSKIDKVVEKEEIDKIVVGLPRNMNGTLGSQADVVEKFVEDHLKKYSRIISFEDETATSLLAEEELRREGLDPRKNKALIDAYSAKIILESWLNNREVEG